MSTRTEQLDAADHALDTTFRTFLDVVMESSATDAEKARILQAHRLYSSAARSYIRIHLITRLHEGAPQ